MSLKNSQLREEITLLIKAEAWPEVKKWFSYWNGDEERIDKCILWLRFFMNHYFVDPTPDFHRDLIGCYFSKDNEYRAAPRGFSKTSIIQGCISFSIANKLEDYIVLIEKSFTEASQVLDAVRTEFTDNASIKQVYGLLMQKKPGSDEKDKDAQGDLLINGVRLRGKGFDSSIRGMKYRQFRPTKIILDDVEDDNHIDNPEQRKKYLDKFNKAIQPAIDIDKGSIKVYGTILHMDSLLMNLITWHNGKIYKAFEEDNPEQTLLWPERWTYIKLMKKKEEMISKGNSSNAFAQEYLNNPISEEDRKFKYQWLWNPNQLINPRELIGLQYNTYCAIDPADSLEDGSDYTGCVVVAIDSNDNWYILDISRQRRNITSKLDLTFEMWDKWRGWNLRAIGFAKNALKDEIMPLFREECNKRHTYPILRQLKEMGRNKESRIEGALVGRFEQNKIFFSKDIPEEDLDILRNELYNFPSAAHDDCSDSLAFISDMTVSTSGGNQVSNMKAPDYSSAVKNMTGA